MERYTSINPSSGPGMASPILLPFTSPPAFPNPFYISPALASSSPSYAPLPRCLHHACDRGCCLLQAPETRHPRQCPIVVDEQRASMSMSMSPKAHPPLHVPQPPYTYDPETNQAFRNATTYDAAPHPQQGLHPHAFRPTVEHGSSGSMPLSGLETPRSPPAHDADAAPPDAQSSLGSADTLDTPCTNDLYTRQLEIFAALERACTTAAHAYWHSQCSSAFDSPPLVRQHRRLGGLYHPYHRHPAMGQHTYRRQHTPNPYSRHQHSSPGSEAATLADYLVLIAHRVWDRAAAQGDAAGQSEAVLRMANLYAWGERVLAAARGERGVMRREGCWRVVMAARDLSSWLLNEEAKREIEALWMGGVEGW